jgi:CHASE1-domain containing sensor protein
MNEQQYAQSSQQFEREAEATRHRLAQRLDELSDRLTPGQVFDLRQNPVWA